jgi:DNA invertase Pin-like site-specific DNA recombinase
MPRSRLGQPPIFFQGSREGIADMSKQNPPPPQLIRGIAYCRKSTKGDRLDRHGKKKQRQEKSIQQQKDEILKLAKDRYEIAAWREDEGISGWKRGWRRPDFDRMLNEVSQLKVEAIVCDNIDRFSRAAFDEVQEDANALRKAGVRWIVTCSHGTYDLGKKHDIGEILKFVVAVWAANEYSRQLSRRISLARKMRAEEGKRSGGGAPYGLELDGDGLKPGDPAKRKWVRWLFEQADQVGNKHRSLSSLAGELNQKGVKPPKGKKWSVRSIGLILRRRAYRGDFTYGSNPQGQFYRLDDKGEVVDKEEVNGIRREPVIVHEGKYTKPLVDPDLFDRVQKRLDRIAKDKCARKREYALSGLLWCAHCGSRMHGIKQWSHVKYRCSDQAMHGPGSCPQRMVREDWLLPRLIAKLKISLHDLVTNAPEHLVNPPRKDRKRTAREKDKLSNRIAIAVESLMAATTKETRQEIDKRINEMRDELRKLDAELAAPEAKGWSNEQLEALMEFWQEFERTAMSLPVSVEDNLALGGGINQDWSSEESCILIDPMKVNGLLHELGIKVSLLWRDEVQVSKTGKPINRHILNESGIRIEGGNGSTRPYTIVSSTSAHRWSGSAVR